MKCKTTYPTKPCDWRTSEKKGGYKMSYFEIECDQCDEVFQGNSLERVVDRAAEHLVVEHGAKLDNELKSHLRASTYEVTY